jgi:hypothetical protein
MRLERPLRTAALALGAAALLGLGCKHKERIDTSRSTPVLGDPSLGLTIWMPSAAIEKPSNGDLLVPIRVKNERDETVRVVCPRCEVELPGGARRKCRDPDDAVVVRSGEEEQFRLLFGDRSQQVTGSTFRVYLWIERGAGQLVEYLPPLVVQSDGDKFAYPPRPFRLDPQTGRPLDKEFPPAAHGDADHGGTVACQFCGEPRPSSASVPCPHCGAK